MIKKENNLKFYKFLIILSGDISLNPLTNAEKKISQKGVIDIGRSDHLLIYCTRKILRAKANMHNQVRVCSIKTYTPKRFVEELKK